MAQRVLERLDAELSNTDDAERPVLLGKVAVVAVVGNEDGAHKIVADCFQALNDIGYTIAAQGLHVLEWRGHAVQGPRRARRGARGGGQSDRSGHAQRRVSRGRASWRAISAV
jgi:hypothetical protein